MLLNAAKVTQLQIGVLYTFLVIHLYEPCLQCQLHSYSTTAKSFPLSFVANLTCFTKIEAITHELLQLVNQPISFYICTLLISGMAVLSKANSFAFALDPYTHLP